MALTVCVLTLVEWPRVAVTLKGRLQQLMAEPFVEGAVAVGGSRWHIFHIHLLPHLWPTLLHLVAAEMARALSVIAQMGVFGILFGGGIMVVGDARNTDTVVPGHRASRVGLAAQRRPAAGPLPALDLLSRPRWRSSSP